MKKAENVVAFKMTDARAKQLLARIADDSNNIIFTRHAMARMKQRKITPKQVINCLKRGEITESPYLDQYGCWKITLERHVAGERIGCAIALDDSREKTIVITVFRVK